MTLTQLVPTAEKATRRRWKTVVWSCVAVLVLYAASMVVVDLSRFWLARLGAIQDAPSPLFQTVYAPLIRLIEGAPPPATSREDFTRFLERRWPVSAIQQFCTSEHRLPPMVQNLVVSGSKWEGELHVGSNTGFDRLYWYGDARDGRLEAVSVNAVRGQDYWVLECGDIKYFRRPPDPMAQDRARHLNEASEN